LIDERGEVKMVDRRSISRRRKKRCFVVKMGGCILLLFWGLSLSMPALSMKTKIFHIVEAGDSVAKIADFYGVSQRDLRELNGLKEGRPLKVGLKLKIPNVLRVAGKKYVVRAGDTLASIGEKFKQTPQGIAAANKLDVDSPLVVGRMLVIPDKANESKQFKTEGKTPEAILFLRVRTGERERLSLYTKSGKLNYKSVKRLSYLARDKRGEQRVKRLHYRLIHMLQQVAEAFPGKPIEIISGYRPQSTGSESQHAFGRAMDFRMSGVSCKALFKFCKRLPRSGCGYYPKSGFVHMDARSKRAAWISHE
jgi:uncharacterized protein YcbK (DUF882 family)